MALNYFPFVDQAIHYSIRMLKEFGAEVDTGHWQGVPTEGKPDLVTREITSLAWIAPVPLIADIAKAAIQPNLPWAEDHFQERVSRVPSNPGEQYKNWPWWRGQEEFTFSKHHEAGQFTHTYQERFWPRWAGWTDAQGDPVHKTEFSSEPPNEGIRYPYGDLDDVVNLLRREPYTRQATLPIFFPEDTGAVHGGRIPCTLHYHFMLRENKLHLWYAIRSCDAVRHFRDDVYMACRLVQWVLGELVEAELRDDSEQIWVDVDPGLLHFTAYSFHVHMGDIHLL